MPVNDGTLQGWPFVNHAMAQRGTQTERGPGRTTIVYPRRKYTFLVEFFFNPAAISPDRLQTDLLTHLQNGRLLATLRSIDHPQTTVVTEKLRSYNKHVLVPTKMEYQPANMTFHDDNSSIIMALWRDYRAYYQHEGTMGSTAIQSGQLRNSNIEEFRVANDMVGGNVRTELQQRPSMGMTVRPNTGRHFFDAIRIYDLGADPDSVNIYTYLYPQIINFAHDNLDYEDRPANVGVSMTFDYEAHYHLIGQNNAQLHDIIEEQLGFRPLSTSGSVPGHARMNPPNTVVNDAIPSLEEGSDGNSFVDNPPTTTDGNNDGLVDPFPDLSVPPVSTSVLPQLTSDIERVYNNGGPIYITNTGYITNNIRSLGSNVDNIEATPAFLDNLLTERGIDAL